MCSVSESPARSSRVWRAAATDDRAAAAVEFALVVPIFLLVVFGMVDFTRAYYTQSALAAAVREGARMASVQVDPSTAANQALVKQRVASFAIPFGNSAIPLNAISIQMLNTAGTNCPGGSAWTNCLNVRVQVTNYTFRYFTPISRIVNGGSRTRAITRQATLRLERTEWPSP